MIEDTNQVGPCIADTPKPQHRPTPSHNHQAVSKRQANRHPNIAEVRQDKPTSLEVYYRAGHMDLPSAVAASDFSETARGSTCAISARRISRRPLCACRKLATPKPNCMSAIRSTPHHFVEMLEHRTRGLVLATWKIWKRSIIDRLVTSRLRAISV